MDWNGHRTCRNSKRPKRNRLAIDAQSFRNRVGRYIMATLVRLVVEIIMRYEIDSVLPVAIVRSKLSQHSRGH